MSELPEGLTEKFHYTKVKKNEKGQDYVAIDGYINRLNDVLGTKWAWKINSVEWHHDIMPPTRNGKAQFLAFVHGTLSIVTEDIGFTAVDEDNDVLTTVRASAYRDGLGAAVNFDPDTAVKSAQAEALKKACHQFGIATYLWDETERDYIQAQREAATDDKALKRLAMLYTSSLHGLGPDEQPTKEQIIKTFGEDLTPDNMRAILKERGVL